MKPLSRNSRGSWIVVISIALCSPLGTQAGFAAPASNIGDRFAKGLFSTPSFPGCRSERRSADPKGCQAQEEVIRLGKQIYIENDSKFVSTVELGLTSIQGKSTYRYLPVLLASLARDSRFVQALRRVSRLEGKAGIRFDYATHAVERITLGTCKSLGSDHPNFREICDLEDQDFNRIRRTKNLK